MFITQLHTNAGGGVFDILLDVTLTFHAFLQSERKSLFVRLSANPDDSTGVKYSILDLNSHLFQRLLLTHVTSSIRLHFESRNDLLHL